VGRRLGVVRVDAAAAPAATLGEPDGEKSAARQREGERRAVRFSTLEAICAALECQPGELLEPRPDGPAS